MELNDACKTWCSRGLQYLARLLVLSDAKKDWTERVEAPLRVVKRSFSTMAVFLLLTPHCTTAEEITLTGVIQDTSNNNLPGITVTLVSTGKSVTTDGNGGFALTTVAPPPRPNADGNVDTIALSKDGYVTKEVEIKNYNNPVNASVEYITDDAGFARFTEQVSMSHSLSWIRGKAKELAGKKLTDDRFKEMVERYGAAEKKDVVFCVHLPSGVRKLKAAFLISEHGVGGPMMEHKLLHAFADKHELALVGVLGDPIQCGMGPASKLEALLAKIGAKLNHPELASVPVFTFGHSNGTGFPVFYAALRPDRVIGWISYHSGSDWHLVIPGIEKSPGLVMHGQKDEYIECGQEQAIKDLRSERNAPVSMMIEGNIGHWPSTARNRHRAFTFVIAFCEACIRTRFPNRDIDPAAQLKPVDIKSGWLGENYDRSTGGLQDLGVAPYSSFSGDKSVANWLPDETFAKQWQRYGKTGAIK